MQTSAFFDLLKKPAFFESDKPKTVPSCPPKTGVMLGESNVWPSSSPENILGESNPWVWPLISPEIMLGESNPWQNTHGFPLPEKKPSGAATKHQTRVPKRQSQKKGVPTRQNESSPRSWRRRRGERSRCRRRGRGERSWRRRRGDCCSRDGVLEEEGGGRGAPRRWCGVRERGSWER